MRAKKPTKPIPARDLRAKPLPAIAIPESQETDELAPPTPKPEDLEDEQITERIPIAVAKLRSSRLRNLSAKPLPAIAKPESQETDDLAPPTPKPEDLEDEQITERIPIAVAKLRSSRLRNLSAKPLPAIAKPESQETDELAPPTPKPEDLEDEQITERIPIAVAKLRSSRLRDSSAKPLRAIAKPKFPEVADVDIKRLPNTPKPKLSEVADIETKQVPAVPKLAEAANLKAKQPAQPK